jgi:uncharacterized protein (TIGR02117 family)
MARGARTVWTGGKILRLTPKLGWPRLSKRGWAWRIAVGLAVLFVIAAVATARPGDRRLYPATGDTVTAYVLNYGFHTDIVLPADVVLARGGRLAEAARAAGNWRWLVIGWGDESFYTGTGMSLERVGDGLRALFWPGNKSVIRFTGLNVQPDKAYQSTDAAALALSPEGFEAMARSIEASFAAAPGEALASSGMRDMPGVFFPSRESFSALRMCNNWTSDQLAAAGLPTTPMVDGLSALLALDLSWRAGVEWAR